MPIPDPNHPLVGRRVVWASRGQHNHVGKVVRAALTRGDEVFCIFEGDTPLWILHRDDFNWSTHPTVWQRILEDKSLPESA